MPSYDTSFVQNNVAEREEAIVASWKHKDVFNTGIRRPGKPTFITYDGPPFATGVPHYGHVLAGSIKAAMAAHKAQEGFDVQTKFGWDCHGVPIEALAQKKLGFTRTDEITKLGITAFNKVCRELIFTCVEEWQAQTKRIGRFIKMENGQDYKTMDARYMSSVWGVFARLNDKGLVYRGNKVVAYSPALGTVLSDTEAGLNYQRTKSPAITMSFPLQSNPNLRFLVWTTTPWSVPANVAVAINPKHAYVKVVVSETEQYIVLKNVCKTFFDEKKYKLGVNVFDIDIKEYMGQKYEPMFDCLPKSIDENQRNNCYQIVSSDHVTDKDGTGCVHICPAYGVDDFNVGKKYDLPVVDFIDNDGFFKELWLSGVNLQGSYFKKTGVNQEQTTEKVLTADEHLMTIMKGSGRLYRLGTVEHEYPFCYRTEKPLMYRAVPSWFLNVTDLKPQLLENNAQVQWHPKHVGANRFGNWLASANDWALSRTRFWGCPIPIWINVADRNDYIVVSSREELEHLSGQKVDDLHRDCIDSIELTVDGKTYRRTPEVFDCWFESGSMPYAQHGFEYGDDAEAFLKQHFPADFIAEGVDQTRGWFYALSVIGTALFGKIPFKNVIVNGILLGSDGKKMSKSVGNFSPISEVLNEYGADALRFFLLSSPAVHAESLSVQSEAIKTSYAHTIVPILNIYKFFADAANRSAIYLNNTLNEEDILFSAANKQLNSFDAWLIYHTELFKKNVTESFDAYDLAKASTQIEEFISDLSLWYIRISRNRATADNANVFRSLHYALDAFCRYAAPIMPFISESIFQGLYGQERSVHLETRAPLKDLSYLKKDYETVEMVRQLHKLSLSIREKNRLRQRQPIQAIYLDLNLADRLQPYEEMLKELINCKEIRWINSSQNELFITKAQLAQGLAARLKRDYKAVKTLFDAGSYERKDEGNTLCLSSGFELKKPDDFFDVIETNQEGFSADFKNDMWMVIDTRLTPDLIQEGYQRDLLREISNIRKKSGCSINDDFQMFISEQYRSLIEPMLSVLKQKKCAVFFDESQDLANSTQATLGEGNTKLVVAFSYKYFKSIHETDETKEELGDDESLVLGAHRNAFFAPATNTETHDIGVASNGYGNTR